MVYLAPDDPLAIRTVSAIKSGDLVSLSRLLAEYPNLASQRILDSKSSNEPQPSRSLLHLVTDWPGHFPHGPEIAALLIAAGADVNARFDGQYQETPLHWAASSDDVAVLDVLLDHGADIEAPGAVIGGGSPLADAAAFGQWKAAGRLVERGARTCLWQAAALGLMDRVAGHFAGNPLPAWTIRAPHSLTGPPDEVTHAFWSACYGGQQPAAEFLFARGADINWLGYDHLTPLAAARRCGATGLVEWLIAQGAK